jgi:hypothetical protein
MTQESAAQAAMGLPKDFDQAVRERDFWYDTALGLCNDCGYYRDMLVTIGELFGQEARIADDGTDMNEVLVAKVPELVAELVHRMKGLDK